METPAPAPVPVGNGPSTAPPHDAIYRRPNAQQPALQPALPPIADYWPDASQRGSAPTDRRTEGRFPAAKPVRGGGTTRGETVARPIAPRPRRRRLRTLLGLVVALSLLIAMGVAGVKLARRPASHPETVTAPPTQAQPPAAAPIPVQVEPAPTVSASRPAVPAPPARTTSPAANNNVLSAPSNGVTSSTFELVSGADTIKLRTAALGADLYRISTPKGGGVLPQVKGGSAGVRLFLIRPDKRRTATVDVVLNSRVRWSLTMTGGVKTGALDLRGSTVAAVNLVGGATRMDLRLPRPKGTTKVSMSGGANQLLVRTTGATPVRVRTRQGAGKVVFNGSTNNGVAKNATFVSPGFDTSTDRIDVDAVAGVGTLTVSPQ